MIEESYVRLYASDFVRMSRTAWLKPLDPDAVSQRMHEARTHAAVMDDAKGLGHLAALVTRLRDEASRPSLEYELAQGNNVAALDHRCQFLTKIADSLSLPE